MAKTWGLLISSMGYFHLSRSFRLAKQRVSESGKTLQEGSLFGFFFQLWNTKTLNNHFVTEINISQRCGLYCSHSSPKKTKCNITSPYDQNKNMEKIKHVKWICCHKRLANILSDANLRLWVLFLRKHQLQITFKNHASSLLVNVV